jgi:DNA-binding protein HU-beta
MFLRTRPASGGRGEYWGGPGGHQRLIPVGDEKKTPAHKALWLLRAPEVPSRDASARLARRGLKQELIDEVARRTPLSRRQVRQALHGVLEVVAEAMSAGEPVTLVGFGRFEAREHQSRDVHGRDGRIYRVERRLVPSFSPYPSLRQRVRAKQTTEE